MRLWENRRRTSITVTMWAATTFIISVLLKAQSSPLFLQPLKILWPARSHHSNMRVTNTRTKACIKIKDTVHDDEKVWAVHAPYVQRASAVPHAYVPAHSSPENRRRPAAVFPSPNNSSITWQTFRWLCRIYRIDLCVDQRYYSLLDESKSRTQYRLRDMDTERMDKGCRIWHRRGEGL